MRTTPAQQVAIQRQQLFRILASLFIAAGSILLALVGTVYYSARLVDQASLQQETLQTNRRIDSTLLKMRNDVRSAAVWNDAHTQSVSQNLDWMDKNFGVYFSDYMNYPVTVAFAPNGAPIYASRNGQAVTISREAEFIRAIAPLVTVVRNEAAARYRRTPDYKAFGLPAHVARGATVLVGGTPYFVTVSNIVPEDEGHRDEIEADPLVATGQRVSSLIPSLAQDLGITRPQLQLNGVQSKGPMVPLIGPDGQAIGKISWVASRPGGQLIMRAAPALLALVVVAFTALMFGMARIRRLLVALAEHEVALDVSRKEAEEANQAKSRFLANMSHELRTPLNGIIAMSEMLHQQQTEPRGRDMTRTVVASGRILERVLNDILDVAKIEAIEVSFEQVPIDMAALLLDVTALHRASAEAKGLTLALNIHPGAKGVYLGDPVRISQIVSNLLSNAVKFTARGGVTVTARPRAHGLALTVSDTGGGFDRETSQRLFNRFEQGDSSISRRHGGTGLGLWICRALARAMGGSVRVRSIVGKGSLFSVYLPLEQSQADTPPVSPWVVADRRVSDDETAPLRVLVAEDHEVNQRVMLMILETIGARVTLVENGLRAVEAFKDSDFDVILMDAQMPIMDGLTATQNIRALERASGALRTPIIAVTANAMAADQALSLAAGSDLHLNKPIRPAQLIEALSTLLDMEAAPT